MTPISAADIAKTQHIPSQTANSPYVVFNDCRTYVGAWRLRDPLTSPADHHEAGQECPIHGTPTPNRSVHPCG